MVWKCRTYGKKAYEVQKFPLSLKANIWDDHLFVL